MTRRNLAHWLTGWLIAAAGATAAHAQMQDAFVEPQIGHDMQLFAPVDFDLEGLPMERECGFLFNYNKLSWAATGERTTIGSRGLTVQSEQIFRQNAFDQGVAPPGYTVQNSIQDAPPRHDFAWGDRYEIGYFRGGTGWSVGVLDGPVMFSHAVYGFQEITIPNQLPLVNGAIDVSNLGLVNGLNFAPGLPPLLVGGGLTSTGAGSDDLSTARTGFGSVGVNFVTPPGYLLGFRDYHINGINNEQGPTVGGPSRQLIVTGTAATIVNGQVVLLQITAATLVSGADGLVDDLDGDGVNGFGVILADINGDGTIDDDEIVANFVDFQDLHQFNIFFDTLFVRNRTETSGVELMRTIDIDNSHLPVKEQRNSFQIGLGARYLELEDNFFFNGRGGILGRTYAETNAQNNIVGPQIRAAWMHQRGRWGIDLDGRFTFGYNIQDLSQIGAIGEDLQPGAINRPANARPTAFSSGRQENNFSPLAEMRVEGTYQLTGAFALKLGYTATFIDNITRSSQIVRYELPYMGMTDGGNQHIFINGVDFGLEAVY